MIDSIIDKIAHRDRECIHIHAGDKPHARRLDVMDAAWLVQRLGAVANDEVQSWREIQFVLPGA